MKVFRCLHVCSLIMFMQGPEEIRLGNGHLHNSCLSESHQSAGTPQKDQEEDYLYVYIYCVFVFVAVS